MATVTNTINDFLKSCPTNAKELLSRWSPAMETQVNVAQGDGTRIKGSVFELDGQRYWHIRVPKAANTNEPHFNDYKLHWPFDKHVEAIGSTGWDWEAKQSRWIGFDFDHITGHAAGVGIDSVQLARVCNAAQSIPWVEVRKSTGGKGLHLYVYFDDGVETDNHTEHQAVARCVLQQMSDAAGFDFASQIDVCGSNMWIWHRKTTAENEGLKLVKPAESNYAVDQLPLNWNRHVDVVTRKRSRVRVDGIEDGTVDLFDAFTAAYTRVELDATHNAIIKKLAATGYACSWVADHHCLQTHTGAFADVFETGEIEGVFETSSPRSRKDEINCYAFPARNGAFKLYRFGQGVAEAPTWTQDTANTWCDFNAPPTFATACQAARGKKIPGGYSFEEATQATTALERIGVSVEIPRAFENRDAQLLPHSNNETLLLVEKYKDESKPGHPWIPRRGGWWQQLLRVVNAPIAAEETIDTDAYLRMLITPGVVGSAGFYCYSDAGSWDCHTQAVAKSFAQSRGVPKDKLEHVIGEAAANRWERVNLPFQPEFPGGRRWNLGAAQRLVQPDLERGGRTKHWDQILNHCGGGLDEALAKQQWALDSHIRTGADYLRALIACILRCPHEPTPYLFLYGPENSGKSIFWESLQVLFTGIVRAERTITGSEFNGELANALVCVLEEINVSQVKGALERIKDYVTSRKIAIRKMRSETFMVENKLHWIHTAQHAHCAPVFVGDTRITMTFVPSLQPGQEIPKSKLLEALETEAPAFLRQIYDMELPPVMGRLRIPVVNTEDKAATQHSNSTELEQFISDNCEKSTGRVALADFCNAFFGSLVVDDRVRWNNKRVKREFPNAYAIRKGGGNRLYIHGLQLKPEHTL